MGSNPTRSIFYCEETTVLEASSSCSCGNEALKTAKEALEKSNMVFVGRITEVIDASSYKQMIFEVGEVWKGEGLVKRDEILLFAPEADCSFDFRVGELYLVYASYNNENMLTTSTCDRTAPLSEAQAD
ncbi:MAG TPA: hypothetical protein VE544_09480 [Nitrososphaeraceae archaeon]|nr:hypothetical protein [Nitrososphaeraceae archaeon]